MKVILHHASVGKWLHFSSPFRIIEATRLDEVLPSLEMVERLVEERGWYAAGFLSYEASSAFDPALCTCSSKFPLMAFGLYEAPQTILLPPPDFAAYSLGEPVPNVSRKQYRHAISRIKQYIGKGDTYQVNYTFRMRMPFSGDPWHLFLAMVHAQPSGYAAWIDMERYAVCSASPELFFRLEGKQLVCKPMKGTVKRGRTLDEDAALAEWLQTSEKNRAENLMIVDMIRNDLGRVAGVGSVRVPQLFEIEKHPTLWQMTSTVTATSEASFSGIMSALFPCASITGAPKIRTTEIIRELEPDPRGLYTGAIGFLAPGRSAQFSVAIRTAVVDRVSGEAEYGSGGGIVWDSAPEDEYSETLLKARVLREQRPAFSLLETLSWTAAEGYFLLDYHLRRLSDSGAYFGFNVDIDQVRQKLKVEASKFGDVDQRVRLTVSAAGEVDIQASPPVPIKLPVKMGVARHPVDSSDVFLYHKTTRRTVYDAARRVLPDYDDVLLYNERKELTEASIANLVLEIDGRLLTPPVNSGLLAGTFRAFLLEQGIVEEEVLTLNDLSRATKVYLVNSVRRWMPAILIRD